MKNMTYRWIGVSLVAPFALLSVACSSEELSAENITLEECKELFPEGEASEDEGDYNDDGDVDGDDEKIEERCEELIEEDAASDDDTSEDDMSDAE